MVYGCCVPFCNNKKRKTTGISYHEFPSNSSRESWLKAIDRQGPTKNSRWLPSDHSLVCSVHFEEDSFKKDCKKRLLLPSAVPTIFPGYPKYKQPKKVIPRKDRELKPYEPTKKKKSNAPNDETGEESNGNQITKEAKPVEVQIVSTETQVDLTSEKIKALHKRWQKAHNRYTYFKRVHKQGILKVREGKEEVEQVKKALKEAQQNPLFKTLLQMQKDAEEGDISALMIMEQVKAYKRTRPKEWPESLVRQCALWRKESPTGYEYARKSKLLKLPSRSSLESRTGQNNSVVPVIAHELSEETVAMIINEVAREPLTVCVEHTDNDIETVDNIVTFTIEIK